MSPSYHAPDEAILSRFRDLLGPQSVLTEPDEVQPFVVEWRDRYFGKTACVLCPNSTEQVSGILKIAHEHSIAVVPQGGNTGLVGGQIPDDTGQQVILSLSKLNKLRHICPNNKSMTVEAGVTLADAQRIASEHDMLFPLSFGSKDKCQIGGNLATNAGGLAVLNYGTARDLVLGLEVVLADGQIWNGLKALRKDNTGYSLKDLFVGSEGTLGIITAAVLKLYSKPAEQITALAGLPSLDKISGFYALSSVIARQKLTAFEILPRLAVELLSKHLNDVQFPLSLDHDCMYCLSYPVARLKAIACGK